MPFEQDELEGSLNIFGLWGVNARMFNVPENRGVDE